MVAALEFACLDLLGQSWGASVSEVLGGRLRERVPSASYLFFRYPHPKTGAGEVRTVDQLVAEARVLKARHGFTTHKVKGAADAHYHHLTDDVIEGGKMRYEGGTLAVPSGTGLGVRLDRDKLRAYHDEYLRLGPYPYDRDPLRPEWAPLVPNDRWADPADARTPEIPL
jgi:L-alanine-DL-glutamate epimerase-like enolase superfamily enzyme